jgi:transcription elongation factor GreA
MQPVGTSSLRPRLATLDGVPETHHLSQATFDRLTAELDELTTHGRTDIARKIQAARELGDLSENGDYHAAKEEQGKMAGRILHLSALLESAEIVEPVDSDLVAAGSIVTICYEGDDTPETFLIGSIEERGGDLDVISPGSPLGQAVLGRTVGDVVDFEAPGGILKVEVTDIRS